MMYSIIKKWSSCVPLRRSLQREYIYRKKFTTSTAGFSYPAPRSLEQIVKLELLDNENVDSIETIWKEYHNDKSDAIASVINTDKYDVIKKRALNSPIFVFPVYRQEGFFNMLCQFQEKHFLLTSLEAYKADPTAAPPCLAITLYDDVAISKGIVLLRADVVNLLDKNESEKLFDQVMATYSNIDLYAWVERFNHKPQEFDFEGYRQTMLKHTTEQEQNS